MNDLRFYEKMPPNEKNFPIKILVQRLRDVVNPHWHEHIELLYFTDGLGYVNCGLKRMYVKKDSFVIVNSNELHSIHTMDKLEYLCAIISPSMFLDVNNSNCIFKNHIECNEFVKDCFGRLYDEFTNVREGYDMAIKGEIYSLFTYLIRHYKKTDISPNEYNRIMLNTERSNSVIMYINSHYNEKLTLSHLAIVNHVSKYYLCHFFKEITGFTVQEYINSIRVEKSKVLLKSTTMGIGEVASNVGYDDVNYFCRIFKKNTTLSPGQYKKLNKI